jgi:hypothetical protein
VWTIGEKQVGKGVKTVVSGIVNRTVEEADDAFAIFERSFRQKLSNIVASNWNDCRRAGIEVVPHSMRGKELRLSIRLLQYHNLSSLWYRLGEGRTERSEGCCLQPSNVG